MGKKGNKCGCSSTRIKAVFSKGIFVQKQVKKEFKGKKPPIKK